MSAHPFLQYPEVKMQPFAGTKDKEYVTIDFDKTDAQTVGQPEILRGDLQVLIFKIQLFLQTSTSQEDEPGVRKTRHNSSLSDLGVATKFGHKVD